MSDTAVDHNELWDRLDSADAVADALFDLYARRGRSRYDEAVTQIEHARHCAALAMVAGAADELIVAALFHDIGHLLTRPLRGATRPDGDLRHEEVGARFLANWFGLGVTEPVRHHVAAKRLLCAVEPDYVAGLSPASVRSLAHQGGPFDAEEAERFARGDHADDAVALRRWDDRAKDPGAPTPELEVFRPIVVDVLGEVRPGPGRGSAPSDRGR